MSWAATAVAPARINIVGEHTDYNGGLVLPTATALTTTVQARPRSDSRIEARSEHFGETKSVDLAEPQSGDSRGWIAYIRGVVAELQAAGVALKGAELRISSDIPIGGGLSSSASLELAVATALLAVAGKKLPAVELAGLCQRAERNHAGVQCGIMDQYTIACAEKGHAILLNCQTLEVEQVPLPAVFGLIVTDSGVRHRLPDGDYNERADECAAAADILSQGASNIKVLSDANLDLINARKADLGETLYRRSRHVVTENARVRGAVKALRGRDVRRLGSLLSASHKSLRDDFEVSCDEIESLLKAANACDKVTGARMVGGGFGGCVLAVCRADDLQAAADEIRQNFARVSGAMPWQHAVVAAHPARVMGDK